jgi:pyrroline-5-carboxylate reductase
VSALGRVRARRLVDSAAMVTDKKLGFIGVGNMGEALVKGLIASKAAAPGKILVSARRRERVDELEKLYRVRGGTNSDVARESDVVVLAVKPQILDQVLREISPDVSRDKLVVSVAAGVPIAAIERRLRPPMRIVRAMPNTPATVAAAATALALGEHATDADLATAKTIFDSVGLTVVLEESQLDAVTGLSGSGPAYVFLILEALSDAGVKVGLSRRTAQLLAAQTVLGSAKLLLETNEHPGRLKDMVTSPGGTAITGLHTLENGGVRTTLMNAVEAATRRSRELGEALQAKQDKR